MRAIINWIWHHGIVGTFLAGLFALLPFAVTVAIMSWAARKLHSMIGPTTFLGRRLQDLGFRFAGADASELIANIVGWTLVLAAIWMLGLLCKSKARDSIQHTFNAVASRIPIVKGIYGTAAQVVGMLQQDDENELKSMNVVYCTFGEQHGAGLLALQASPDMFRFRGQDCYVVYLPTSPIPMSGGIVFVPTDSIVRVKMKPEDLMQIYFSLGVLTSNVVPQSNRVAAQS